MPDRVTGTRGAVRVDLPGVTSGVGLTIVNPYGEPVVDTTLSGDPHGRYSYTPDDPFDIPGTWLARWSWGSSSRDQLFTVGPRLHYARSLYELRIDVARRVVPVHEGIMLDARNRTFSDPTLIGGDGNYEGSWVAPDPAGPDAGRALLVEEFNGSVVKVTPGFYEDPADGTPYVLMGAEPREVDRAISVAVQDLGHLARIPITLDGMAVDDDGTVLLPDYLSHVSDVWTTGGERLGNAAWSTRPGRRLNVTTADATVTVSALASASVPLWEDSLVDLGPAVVIARAAMQLHANRAGSQTIDLEEHLRRQLAAREEFEDLKRNEVGRIPPGSLKVIE